MILITDFDNTLYSHSDPQVLIDNLQVAQSFRQAGNKFVLATGRNASSLSRVLPDFNKYFDYIILDNGAFCLGQDNEIVFQYAIPEEIARSISRRVLGEYGDGVTFVYYHSAREWPTLDHDTTKIRCWATNVQIGNDVHGETALNRIEKASRSCYTTRIIRRATLSTEWQIIHFVLKLSLSLTHAILYNRIAKHFDTASTLSVILGVTCAVIIIIGIFLQRDPCKD